MLHTRPEKTGHRQLREPRALKRGLRAVAREVRRPGLEGSAQGVRRLRGLAQALSGLQIRMRVELELRTYLNLLTLPEI